MIATVKSGGLCPCPRCLVEQAKLDPLGRIENAASRASNIRVDTDIRQKLVKSARDFIYKDGYAVKYKKVNELLKPTSLVPTEVRKFHHNLRLPPHYLQNAFSILNPFGFDVFSSLVVDLMHEFELGVWKALFIHLIRILEAHDKKSRLTTVSELDKRFVSKGSSLLAMF
jgi:hypothetical protein